MGGRKTSGTVMNGGRRRNNISRGNKRPTRFVLRKMVEEKIIRQIRVTRVAMAKTVINLLKPSGNFTYHQV
jgi:hypothetical protein